MTVLIIVLAAWVVVAALIVVFVGGAALDRPDIHDGAQMRQQRAERWAEIQAQSDRAADEFCHRHHHCTGRHKP